MASSAILLISTIILASSIVVTQTQGTECDGLYCSQTRGYLNYKPSHYTYLRRRTIMSMEEPTTFVLHFKKITGVDRQEAIVLHQIGYGINEVLRISSNEDQIFIFKDTFQVMIFAADSMKLYYTLEFYLGCEILEGKNITINRQAKVTPARQTAVDSPYMMPHPASPYEHSTISAPKPMCWFILPTVETLLTTKYSAGWNYFTFLFSNHYNDHQNNPEEFGSGDEMNSDDNEIKQMYFTLANVRLSNNSTVQVTDMLSGSTVLSAQEEKSIPLLKVESHNTTLMLNKDQQISSLFFVELKCSEQCEANLFQLFADGLVQSDLDCMQMEQNCRYNIGPVDYNCTTPKLPTALLLEKTSNEELAQSQCPVWNKILSTAASALPVPELQQDLQQRTWVDKCTDYHGYCFNRTCPEGQCQFPCFLITKVLKLCHYLGGSSSAFV